MIFQLIDKTMKKTLILITSILFVASPAFAANYYVSNSGCSDAFPGTQTQPICSINEVNSRVNPGDVVYFENTGTWTAGSGKAVLTPKGGVKYIGDQWGKGERATFVGNSGLRDAVIYFDDDHETIPIIVKGFDADVFGKSLDGISILHDGAESKSLVGAAKRIENCLVHGTGSGYHYGITVAPNSTNERVKNVEIINNKVFDITRTGIPIYPYTKCTGCGIENVLVQGNEVFDTGMDSSSAGHGILVKNDVKNTTIKGNHLHHIDTLYSTNKGHAIAIEEMGGIDPNTVSITSNLIRDDGTSWLYIAGAVGSESRSTITEENNTIYSGTPPPWPEGPSVPKNLRILP